MNRGLCGSGVNSSRFDGGKGRVRHSFPQKTCRAGQTVVQQAREMQQVLVLQHSNKVMLRAEPTDESLMNRSSEQKYGWASLKSSLIQAVAVAYRAVASWGADFLTLNFVNSPVIEQLWQGYSIVIAVMCRSI